MSQVLIIDGHPSASSLCAAIAERYAAAMQKAAIEAEVLALRNLNFDPILHVGYHEQQALEPDLLRAKQAIGQAKRIVLVTPVWWGSVPALLKGFLDRVLERGWAFRYRSNGAPEGLLTGRSARIIITTDSPDFYLRWIQGDSTMKSLVRSTFGFCGFKPVDTTRIGPVHRALPDRIAKWLQQIDHVGASDAQTLKAG